MAEEIVMFEQIKQELEQEEEIIDEITTPNIMDDWESKSKMMLSLLL